MPFYDYMSKDDINTFRVSLGLPPIRRGERPCMCCGASFFSEDQARVRICDRCKLSEERSGYNN